MDNREIDKQIAEKIMGWKDLTLCEGGDDYPADIYGTDPEGTERIILYKNYSTRPDHAFEVVEKMKELGWYLNGLHALEGHDVGWEAVFESAGDIKFESAGTPAMAICLAALETIKDS